METSNIIGPITLVSSHWRALASSPSLLRGSERERERRPYPTSDLPRAFSRPRPAVPVSNAFLSYGNFHYAHGPAITSHACIDELRSTRRVLKHTAHTLRPSNGANLSALSLAPLQWINVTSHFHECSAGLYDLSIRSAGK